jgi:two-component system, chemotaxis family, response regulator Rcp1
MDQPHVLLVENSSGDRRLAEEAFRDANGAVILDISSDGVDAMAFLRREGVHVDAVRPAFILLALSGLECREVLALIKSDADLKSIPTIVLGTSDAVSDVVKCYELKANCYMSKPEHYDGFAHLVRLLIDFWLTTAQRPTLDAGSGQRSASPAGAFD